MSAVLVLLLVALAAGPGRPESSTRGSDENANATVWSARTVVDAAAGASNATNATTDRGLDSGNPFWDRLYWECGKRTSLRCVQKSAFRFLKKSLGEKDVFVTDSLVFRHNHNAAVTPHPLAGVATMLSGEPAALKHDDGADSLENELLQPNALPSVEDLTDDLYDQGMSFIKSHDVHLRLPSLLGGAEVRLSPRAFEEDGATFKISFSRPHVDPALDQALDQQRAARFMFNVNKGSILKRITQKLFKKKLMTSFFALLLIVKMIKVKLMFLLPLILGVGTAKKLLLKVLLFLFPALSHLFKLCSYYHANYAKYHHHHHKIAHHHHVIPVPVPQPVVVGQGLGQGANPWDDQRVYRHTPNAGGKRKQGGVDTATPSPSSPPPAPSLANVVGPTVEVAYDAFYSPLLQRMDNVFVQLGFNEEACRERLVCSMYKKPSRFAPHSNLVSAELSRDPTELQKPSSLNSAVVRFYRYVQAARDGQNAKDCLTLYPACTVNTDL
ncbi:uncharacterized protein LOC117653249 [Thrips palmi]|uniref:Uncharacterized protein LOC117653249 n=1 Tax=Thrips palmi TaxID=161013 RepID=A0A6P9ABD3_THRPL|nr:uncharacterized protein LOC117653249 [Thrips palmi]